MVKQFILIPFFLLAFQFTLAQNDSIQSIDTLPKIRRAKAIYVEALGSSAFGLSLNYDMRFKPGHEGWGFRIGMAQPYQASNATTYYFPLIIGKVHSDKRVAFEHGIGPIVIYKRWEYEDLNFNIHQRQGFSFIAAANVGVRFQPMKTGIVWRLYWNPNWQIGSRLQKPMWVWFGTALGIGFN